LSACGCARWGWRNEADEWQRLSALPGTAKPDLSAVKSSMDSLAAQADRISTQATEGQLPEVAPLLLLCRAECDRAGWTGHPTGWANVAEAWEALHRPYPAAYAWWQEAEAAARHRISKRAQRAALRANQIAELLGAEPLRREVVSLARRARLDLDPPRAYRPHYPSPIDPFNLTERERQVLALLCQGRTNRQIARPLYITEKTAGVHVSNVLAKLGVSSRGEAAAVANRLNLLPEQTVD
jgi:DNA-binding CsgD family transcriptional regulator